MDKSQVILGSLLILFIASGIFYVTMDNVKLRVDTDKSTFYVLNDSRWIVTGREYNKLFEGTSLKQRELNETSVDIQIDDRDNLVNITRYTKYKVGPVIKDTYLFDGKLTDIRLFPIKHTIELINATGYIYQYEVRDLIYSGETIKDPKSPLNFGGNMKLEWDDGAYWSTIYKSGIFKARWKPISDYEVYNVRLFDPTSFDDNWNYTAANYTFTCESNPISGGDWWTVVGNVNTTTVYHKEGSRACASNSSTYVTLGPNATVYGAYESANYSVGMWLYFNGSMTSTGDGLRIYRDSSTISLTNNGNTFFYYSGNWFTLGVTIPLNEWFFLYGYTLTPNNITWHMVRDDGTSTGNVTFLRRDTRTPNYRYLQTDFGKNWIADNFVVWKGNLSDFPTSDSPPTPGGFNSSSVFGWYNFDNFTLQSRITGAPCPGAWRDNQYGTTCGDANNHMQIAPFPINDDESTNHTLTGNRTDGVASSFHLGSALSAGTGYVTMDVNSVSGNARGFTMVMATNSADGYHRGVYCIIPTNDNYLECYSGGTLTDVKPVVYFPTGTVTRVALESNFVDHIAALYINGTLWNNSLTWKDTTLSSTNNLYLGANSTAVTVDNVCFADNVTFDKTSYNCDGTSKLTGDLQMTLSGFSRNITAELGSVIDVVGNSTNDDTVYLDIDHYDYGGNYTSGIAIDIDFNISSFRKTTIEYNLSEDTNQTLNYTTAPTNNTVYLILNERDICVNASVNLTGDNATSFGTYPSDVNIYIDGELSNSIGEVRAGQIKIDALSDGDKNETVSFITGNETNTVYLKIPKQASISYANHKMEGAEGVVASKGDGSDGELYFTTATKSYGNLVLGTDYSISGNVLYLNLNRKYQFTKFTLGPGTTLRPKNTVGAVMYILSQNEMNISGDVDLNGEVTAGKWVNYTTIDGRLFNAPQVQSGGRGVMRVSMVAPFYTREYNSEGSGYGGGGGGGRVGWPADRCVTEFGSQFSEATGGNGQLGGSTAGLGYEEALYTNSQHILFNTYAYGNTNTTGNSAGGSGAISVWWYCTTDDSNFNVTRGEGASAHGHDGTDVYDSFQMSCAASNRAYCIEAGGGGGSGGYAGKSGIHFFTTADSINFQGSINTGGSSGQSGGDGGMSMVYFRYEESPGEWTSGGAFLPYGGGGGGGGGGGNAGSIYFYSDELINNGTLTYSGGTGGIGGTTYKRYDMSSRNAEDGASGTAGTFTEGDINLILEPEMYVGTFKETPDWNYTGYFNVNSTTSDYTWRILDYLVNCTADSNGDCLVPIFFQANSSGAMVITDINVTYEYNINPVYLNVNLINEYLDGAVGTVSIPVQIESQTAGRINITDIRLDYLGGNKTYAITLHDSSYTNELIYNVTYFYSGWNYSYPNSIDHLSFYPWSKTAKSVTPFGQNTNTPIYNISSYSNSGRNFTFYGLMYGNDSCINLTISANSTKAHGTIMTNNTWINLKQYMNSTMTFGAWMWADYFCTDNTWRIWNPDFYFRACCDGCDICSESY